MKKLLLLLTLILYATTAALAEDVTVTCTNTNVTNVASIKANDNISLSFTIGGGNNSPSQGATYLQFYGGNKLNIKATNATITKVVIECTSTSYPGAITATENNGTASLNNSTTTWSGSTVDLTLQNGTSSSQKQARIKTIEITYDVMGGGDNTPSCTKPTVSTEGDVFTISGDAGDTFYYTLKKGEEAIETDKEYTTPIDPSANGYGTYTLTAYATREGANKSATSDPATITLIDPNAPKFYTVTFKTGSGAGTQIQTTTKVTTVISEGTDYVSGFSNISQAYYAGDNGLRIGSSNNAGNITVSIADKGKANVDKIVFRTAKYSTDASTLSISINGSDVKTGLTPGDSYTYIPSSSITLSSIKFATSAKRAYVSGFDVYYKQTGGGEEEPESCTMPAITVNGTTFTVSGQDEGCDVYYSVNHGETAVVTEKKYEGEVDLVEFGPVHGYGKYTVKAWAQHVGKDGETIVKSAIAEGSVTLPAPPVTDPDDVAGIESDHYKLVTSADQLIAGRKVVFVGEKNNVKYVMGKPDGDNCKGIDASTAIKDDFYVSSTDIAALTLKLIGNANTGWYLKDEDGKWLTATGTSSSNKLGVKESSYFTSDNNGQRIADITYNNGELAFKFKGGEKPLVRFNPNNNNTPLFNGYASNSTTGTTFAIYQQTEEHPVDPLVVAAPTIEFDEATNTVTLSTTQEAEGENVVEIHYTLTGEDPTESDAKYTEPFTISTDCTVKAVTYLLTEDYEEYYSDVVEKAVTYTTPKPAPAPLISIADGEVTKVGHSIVISIPEGVNAGYSYEYTLSTPSETEIEDIAVAEDVTLKLDEEGEYILMVTGYNEYDQEGEINMISFTAEAYGLFLENYHAYGTGHPDYTGPGKFAMTYNNESKAYEVELKELFGEFLIKSECGTFKVGGHDKDACDRKFGADGKPLSVRARAGEQESVDFNLSERYVSLTHGAGVDLYHGENVVNFSTHTADEMTRHNDVKLSLSIDPEAVTNATAYAEGDAEVAEPIKVGSMSVAVGEVVQTGVSDIAVDGTDEAVYYNLQGMRVPAPQPGQVLIERRGTTVQKRSF